MPVGSYSYTGKTFHSYRSSYRYRAAAHRSRVFFNAKRQTVVLVAAAVRYAGKNDVLRLIAFYWERTQTVGGSIV